MLLSELGVPTRTVNALKKKKIYTENDLLRKTPRYYKDYRVPMLIDQCTPKQYYAVKATILRVEKKKSAKEYLAVRMVSGNGRYGEKENYFTVFFFTRLFLARTYSTLIGKTVVVLGKVTFDETYGFGMQEPDRILPEEEFAPAIVPVYSKVAGVSDETYEQLVNLCLKRVHEPFEWELMNYTKCMDYKSALTICHRPSDIETIEKGKKRLKINDLLYFAIGLRASSSGPAESKILFRSGRMFESFMESLPFELTEDQERVIRTICETCSSEKRLNTLLYGDVGAGKTVVAVAFAMLAASNGYQSVIMAPRGVLAGQHYQSILEMTGLRTEEVVYLHSALKSAEKKLALKRIKDGIAKIIVGTHSCIAKSVIYHKLGAVIVDEEHLFGVEQKEEIQNKACDGVHVLSMSATPIPRTLASIVYGEDRVIERLHALPKGRLPIKTAIVEKREQTLRFLLKEIRAGHQAYIVCPAIEEGNDAELASVEEMEKIYGDFFRVNGVTYASLTGKLDEKESEKVMKEFVDRTVSALISTTVVEVGVNVPNATVIVIEQAERFGLASLHQLRGRVGRGNVQSYCILRTNETENERLHVIESTTNGIEIAEEDLKLRGSGDLLGVKQAGSNYYVELMLENPGLFAHVNQLADWCLEERLGNGLISLYHEHETAVGTN